MSEFLHDFIEPVHPEEPEYKHIEESKVIQKRKGRVLRIELEELNDSRSTFSTSSSNTVSSLHFPIQRKVTKVRKMETEVPKSIQFKQILQSEDPLLYRTEALPGLSSDPRRHEYYARAERLKFTFKIPQPVIDQNYVGDLPPQRIYASNLPQASIGFVELEFCKYGVIQSVEFVKNKVSGKNLKKCSIVFAEWKGALTAVESLKKSSMYVIFDKDGLKFKQEQENIDLAVQESKPAPRSQLKPTPAAVSVKEAYTKSILQALQNYCRNRIFPEIISRTVPDLKIQHDNVIVKRIISDLKELCEPQESKKVKNESFSCFSDLQELEKKPKLNTIYIEDDRSSGEEVVDREDSEYKETENTKKHLHEKLPPITIFQKHKFWCSRSDGYIKRTKGNRLAIGVSDEPTSKLQRNQRHLLRSNPNHLPERRLVVQASGIHSLGLFTLDDIQPGTFVSEFVGQVIRRTVALCREALSPKDSFLFRIDDHLTIDASSIGNHARFINHSCDPNCFVKVVTEKVKQSESDSELVSELISKKVKRKIVFYSKRFIRRGEELFIDYKFDKKTDKKSKTKCLCQSPNCRKYLD